MPAKVIFSYAYESLNKQRVIRYYYLPLLHFKGVWIFCEFIQSFTQLHLGLIFK